MLNNPYHLPVMKTAQPIKLESMFYIRKQHTFELAVVKAAQPLKLESIFTLESSILL